MKRHRELLTAAIARDGDGQRALMAGDGQGACEAFLSAADLYRQSWEEAPPGSYGRLVGMLKATVLSGDDPRQAAGYVQRALPSLPKQGSAVPWRVYQNYPIDRMMLRRGRVDDKAMEFVGG